MTENPNPSPAMDAEPGGPRTALEALSECGLSSHVAEAVVHDLDLIGWEVRPQGVDIAAAKAAALRALGVYTGADPAKPWWNLDMPKALDIMLPAIFVSDGDSSAVSQ